MIQYVFHRLSVYDVETGFPYRVVEVALSATPGLVPKVLESLS